MTREKAACFPVDFALSLLFKLSPRPSSSLPTIFHIIIKHCGHYSRCRQDITFYCSTCCWAAGHVRGCVAGCHFQTVCKPEAVISLQPAKSPTPCSLHGDIPHSGGCPHDPPSRWVTGLCVSFSGLHLQAGIHDAFKQSVCVRGQRITRQIISSQKIQTSLHPASSFTQMVPLQTQCRWVRLGNQD